MAYAQGLRIVGTFIEHLLHLCLRFVPAGGTISLPIQDRRRSRGLFHFENDLAGRRACDKRQAPPDLSGRPALIRRGCRKFQALVRAR